MSSSSSSNPNLSESDQDLDALNPNVPISVIKRLVIRMKELESSIAAWNLSLKGSVRLGRIERESIRSNIKIDESQRKSLLIGYVCTLHLMVPVREEGMIADRMPCSTCHSSFPINLIFFTLPPLRFLVLTF